MRRIVLAVAAALALAAPAEGATPGRITVITDSVGGILAYPDAGGRLLGKDLDLDVEAVVCRRLVAAGCHAPGVVGPPSATDTIRLLGAKIGTTVVVDVGYNDPSDEYAAGIDETMTLLAGAGVEHVVWVTLEEREGVWVQSNGAIRAAATRWPQLTVADWAAASASQTYFVDDAHLTAAGGLALAAFLRPVVLRVCGTECALDCGLLRAANGFDAVQAIGTDCAPARAAIAGAERGDAGAWVCSRAVGGAVELDCLLDGTHARVLERSPDRAVRRGGVIVLGGWSFRLAKGTIEGREGRRGWARLARSPFCVPDVPREVLLALRLRPVTPNGGCFVRR